MNPCYRELAEAFASSIGIVVEVEEVGDTCIFEAECFELSCVISDDTLEIRNIKTRQRGWGRQIITVLHEYCDDHGLSAYASNVRQSAIVFWEKMGYIEGQTSEEFFRA